MKIRKTKKGFTIVELVIVIAVIGILAAILIPTFIGLTNRANEASDNALVNNLNKALKIEEGEQGKKPETFQAAIDGLKNQGYLLNQISSKSGKELVWNQTENQFVLNPENSVGAQYWEIVNAMPSTQKHSYYAGEGWNAKDVTVNKYGFDAGERTNIETVTYNSSDANDVVIRTNSFTMDVNVNTTGSVNHYGKVGKLDIQKVAMASFHEFGDARTVTLKEGNYVIEENGSATLVSVVATETGKVELNIKGDLEVLAGDASVYTVTAGAAEETIDASIDNDTDAIVDGIAVEELDVSDFDSASKVVLLKDFAKTGLVLNHDIEIVGNMTKLNAQIYGTGNIELKNIHTTNIHGPAVSGKTYLYNGINFNGCLTFDGGYLEYDGTNTSNNESAAIYINAGFGSYIFKNMTIAANTNKGIKISKAASVTVESCEFDASKLVGEAQYDQSGSHARSLSAIDIQEQNDAEKMNVSILGCTFTNIPQGNQALNVKDADTAAGIKLKGEIQGFAAVEIKNNTFNNCYRDVAVGVCVRKTGNNSWLSKKTPADMRRNAIGDNWTIADNKTTLTETVIGNRGYQTYEEYENNNRVLAVAEKVGSLKGGCGVWETALSTHAHDDGI